MRTSGAAGLCLVWSDDPGRTQGQCLALHLPPVLPAVDEIEEIEGDFPRSRQRRISFYRSPIVLE